MLLPQFNVVAWHQDGVKASFGLNLKTAKISKLMNMKGFTLLCLTFESLVGGVCGGAWG